MTDFLGAGPPLLGRTVHGGEWRPYPRSTRDQPFLRCKGCGSLTPAEALRRLTTPTAKFSCTDKGAYKFYIEGEVGTGGIRESTISQGGVSHVTATHKAERDYGKFYGEHLADLTFEEMEAFSVVSRRVFGYDFLFQGLGKDPRVRKFSTGQTWGVIGPDGMPVFGEGSGLPGPEDQWPRDMMREALKLPDPQT